MTNSTCAPWVPRLLATTALTSAVLLTVHAATVGVAAQTLGPDTPAPYVQDRSGTAGPNGPQGGGVLTSQGGPGGAGAAGSPVTVEVSPGASLQAADSATTLSLTSNGGAGGMGGDSSSSDTLVYGNGGPAGKAGAGGTISLQLDANGRIASPVGGGAAVDVTSNGGSGGDGGNPANRGAGGTPSDGGTGGIVILGLAAGATITSTSQNAPAIRLYSNGGDGGVQTGGSSTSADESVGKSGGNGGAGGSIQTLPNGIAGTIASDGSGVLASSRGGNGNDGGQAGGSGDGGAYGGNGGAGGAGGSITLQLSGPTGLFQAAGPAGPGTGASIQVDGPNDTALPATISVLAAGVSVQSLGGSGGSGGDASGNFAKAVAGSGGAAGNGGNVAVTTTGGSISTTGYSAVGILGLSTGGAGGNGANAGSVVRARGGNGAAGGNGGSVTLSLCQTACQGASGPALISTTGEDSDAVVAQSIGGGGGYGGDVSVGGVGASIAIGGSGAQGGQGAEVTVLNGAPGISSGPSATAHVISTTGEYSRGLVAQSVGGGGGRGGDANAIAFGALSLSIGGTGGTGGTGGAVSLFNNGIVQTEGALSNGVDAQSVGGGGGAGGAATSVTVGAQVTTSVAVGGSGGSGNDAGNLQVGNTGQVGTLGDASVGIFAQSVGGGGGHGGASVAKTFQVFSLQDPPVPSVNLNVSLGGTGGKGGVGGQVTLNNIGLVFTGGTRSPAIVAQSIGGGGGDGGAATAYSQQFRASTVSVSTAIGGNGGTGGTGGAVQAQNGGLLWTLAKQSDGIIAQSVGGGGGAGGFGEANTGSFQGAKGLNVQATVSIGGSGGSGNVGGPVTVNNYYADSPPALPGSILTRGDLSVGIFAQSVGGGGGIGAHALAQGSGGQVNVNIGLGGSGGSGNHGGKVSVDNGAGAILTAGASSHGIMSQSVGGGGGRGGDAATGAGTDPEIAAYNFIATGAGIGQGNQVVGNIYDLKDNLPTNVNLSGRLGTLLTTYELQNDAVPPDPVPEQESFTSKVKVDVGVAFAGKGGSGGDGGAVTVANAGSIETRGPRAFGMYAQSIGGGGGDGGATHAATSNDVVPNSVINGAVGVGGGGGSSGSGGTVTVSNTGSIQTAGDLSHGIFAHSVGGGGGAGGATLATASAGLSFDVGIGGGGGASGNGGPVSVSSLQGATIRTFGDAAVGIAAQSVGGGGGLATLMSSDVPGAGGHARSSTGPFTTGPLSRLPALSIFRVVGNGGNGASGQGGAVSTTLDVTANNGQAPWIITSGVDAYGILAQSVGGGGGWVSGVAPTTGATLSALFPSGKAFSGDGGAITVSLDNSSYIYTSGAGAVGILAQSIGGGGGLIGGMSQVQLDQGFTTTPNAQTGQGGNIAISLQNGANIVTTGDRAHGIFAQSVGGGGGVLAQTNGAGFTFAAPGSYAGCSGTSCTGSVAVSLGNNTVVRASGQDAYAVLLQSRGNGVNDTTLTLGTNSFVEGWGKASAAVFVDGAGKNTINNAGTIDNGTLNGVVTPSGLAIAGSSSAGLTTINNSGTINGALNLPGGSVVNNAVGGTFRPGSVVNLGASGTLVNSGLMTLGSPGQTSRTTLVGDFQQTGTGVLRVNLQANSNTADHLQVNGTARVEGSVDVVVHDPAKLKPGTKRANILNATGGVTVNSASLSLTGTPVTQYRLAAPDSNNLHLEYTVDYGASQALQAQGLTSSNRTQIGHTLNTVLASDGSALALLTSHLAAVPTARELAAILDSLSGEAAADVQQTVFATQQAYTSAVHRHVLSGTFDKEAASYATASLGPIAGPSTGNHGMRVWVGGFGANDVLKGTDGQGSLHTRTAGAIAGLDKWFDSDRMAGFSIGGGVSDFTVFDRASQGHTTSVNLGFHGLARFGQAYVSGVVSYGNFATNLKRTTFGSAIGLAAAGRGSVTSNVLGGRAELGWRRPLGDTGVALTPFAALELNYLWQGEFSESLLAEPSGSGLGLRYRGAEQTSVPLTLGSRVSSTFHLPSDRVLSLSAELGWVHEFNPRRSLTAAFLAAPTVPFRVRGVSASRDSALVGFDAKLSLTRSVALLGSFNGRFSSVETAVGGFGGLQVTW